MRRLYALALLVAFLAAGCRAAAQPATPAAQPATSAAQPATSAAPPSGQIPDSTVCDVPDGQSYGLLAAVRTERYTDHDRVVFQFDGPHAPAAYIRYVDRVTEDPSDRPVPLLGTAFVNIAFHGARLDTSPVESDPDKAHRYAGPTRLTPRHPTLQELAVSGDFEAVLSFGLGLSTVARLSVATPENRGCLILDVWRSSPETLLWPITSVAQAQTVQRATEQGHQPWVLSAEQVASGYAHQVLGWPQATIKRLGEDLFQAEAGAQLAIISVTRPLGRPGTVWTVTAVLRSRL